MERIRRVMDEYPGTATVGEMGESHHAIEMMGDYTAPCRLHQCYSFELMGYEFEAGFFRQKVEGFFKGAPDGWPMWAFSNHDVIRHVTRWEEFGAPEQVAKLAAAREIALVVLKSAVVHPGHEVHGACLHPGVRRIKAGARHCAN